MSETQAAPVPPISESARLPLAGLRVIETGHLVAGPFCAQLLADFGAEVIKLEAPEIGDQMRNWGREKAHGMTLWWPIVGRNKKSVTLNLRTPAGQQIARDLLATADVLVENFRPGTLERWGLGPSDLEAVNPGLVLVRVSGWGQDGPSHAKAGFGAIGEAIGGLRYITGDPGSPPARTGISLGDSLAGIFAALGCLVALWSRQETQRGQVVDSAIYEAILSLTESMLPEYHFAGTIRERSGSILPRIAPSNVYSTTSGGYVLIAANHDTVFRRLAEVMEQPGLADDPRFVDHASRGANQAVLDEIIEAWTQEREATALLALLDAAGVPAGKLYRAPEMFEDPHFAAREDIVWPEHDTLGPFPMPNVAPKLSATPGSVRWAGPRLGQHNDEIYRDLLGLSSERLEALRRDGTI